MMKGPQDSTCIHTTIGFAINLDRLDEKKRVKNRSETLYGWLTEMVRKESGNQPYDTFTKEAWYRWHDHLGDTHSYMKH